MLFSSCYVAGKINKRAANEALWLNVYIQTHHSTCRVIQLKVGKTICGAK